ncbi:hypothetical protein Efla_007654 [Eimeria flavescens]
MNWVAHTATVGATRRLADTQQEAVCVGEDRVRYMLQLMLVVSGMSPAVLDLGRSVAFGHISLDERLATPRGSE